MNLYQFISFFFATSLSLSNWRVSSRLEVSGCHRSIKHCGLVVRVQIASFEVATKHNWMFNRTIISQAHFLDLVRVIPEHITVVSNKSRVIIKRFMHNLLLFFLRQIQIKNWLCSRHSHRGSSEVFRISLITLMKDNTVWIHRKRRLNLFLQFGNRIDIEAVLRNTWLWSNNLTINIKWFHVVWQINLRVLHLSKLTLWLVSVSRRISFVDCDFRV
jgi:hypothetical protein